jgi:hypothetical protein
VRTSAYALILGSTTVLGTLAGGPAFAATVLNVTDTVTNTGSVGTPTYTVTPVGPANSTISPTTTLTLGDAFNGSGQVATPANFGVAATGSGGPWNFQDDFNFATSGGSTIYTATIALPTVTAGGTTTGLTDLQARIIYGVFNGSPVNGPPTLGPPAGGTLVDSWQTLNLGPNGSYTVTMPTGFAAGSYILQIRGEAAAAGGAYGGTIGFTAVPLPAALPLLLSGLGLMGSLARRKRAAIGAATGAGRDSSPRS